MRGKTKEDATGACFLVVGRLQGTRLFWTVEQESEKEYEEEDNVKLKSMIFMILIAEYVQKQKVMYLQG